MKILLIAGHGAGDPGACSNYGIEANETRRVVDMLKSQFGTYNNISIDVYPTNRNAYEDVKNGCIQVNFANYDYVLEIHFNSAGNILANGTEVWVTPAESGINVEQLIVNKIASLGYLNRGVKREDFAVIRNVKNKGVSSALIEICFISNQNDMNKYNDNFENICKNIVDGVCEGFGLSKNNNIIVTPQPVKPLEKPKVNYFVKTAEGKQLGAFSVLDNAKNMAKTNNSIVYNANGSVLVSYVPVRTSVKYINLKAHMTSWRVYKESSITRVGNECGFLNPSLGKALGGLTYTVLKEWGNDVYSIKTSSFGVVKIYCPNDNDGCVSTNKLYEFVN